MYLVTVLGITTVVFHRLFVHRSFETCTWVKVLLVVAGSMAVQGSLFRWVGLHCRHHRYSDRPEDPHTPHHQGVGIRAMLKGFWHAHIGGFFDPDPEDLDPYIKDLAADPALRVVNRRFPLWILIRDSCIVARVKVRHRCVPHRMLTSNA